MLSVISHTPRAALVVAASHMEHRAAPVVRPIAQMSRRVVRSLPSAALKPPPGSAPMPQPAAMAVAAVVSNGLPWVLAKTALACMLGLGMRRVFEHANAAVEFPPEALVVPTIRQRENAVNTLGVVACLLCFALLP